jgi:hypothetical protein
MLDQARRSGERLLVLFGCAEGQVIELVYCALLDDITIGSRANKKTIFQYSQLKPISPALPIRLLTLLEKGLPLSTDFIYPYALCLTPPFVRELLEDVDIGGTAEGSAGYA